MILAKTVSKSSPEARKPWKMSKSSIAAILSELRKAPKASKEKKVASGKGRSKWGYNVGRGSKAVGNW